MCSRLLEGSLLASNRDVSNLLRAVSTLQNTGCRVLYPEEMDDGVFPDAKADANHTFAYPHLKAVTIGSKGAIVSEALTALPRTPSL